MFEASWEKLLGWALGGAGLATATMLAAFFVEWQLEIRDRKALAPFDDAARWVELPDGIRLRVERRGPDGARAPGEPVYILMSGLAGSLEAFGALQAELARAAPTFAYDRAGTGFSDAPRYDGKPRDARQVADELAQLLKAANVAPPYVIVAHSIAGLYARIYAHQYPEGLRAVVLLDPLTEDEWSLVSPTTAGIDQDFMFRQAPRTMALAYLGLRRFKAFLKGKDPRSDAGLAIDLRGDHWRAASREAEAVFSSFELIRIAPFPGSATLAVLSAGEPQTADVAIVQRLHGEVAKASGEGGLHAVAAGADHGGVLAPAHAEAVAAFIRKAAAAPASAGSITH